MASLLSRIKGDETDPEYDPEIPDSVPEEWSGLAPDDPPADRIKPSVYRPVPSPGATVTPAMKKRISAELRAYGLFLIMPVQIRDPVCGDVAQAQVEPIADAIADILGHYPELAAKFVATGVLAGWLKLGMALKPLLECGYHHHIAKDHPALDQQQDGGDGVDLGAYLAYRPGQ